MIAKLMELANTLFRYRGTAVAGGPEWDEAIRLLLLMLAPAAPHISEELWSRRLAAAGRPWSSIHAEAWPEVDPTAVVEATREIPVQVNGKLRDKVTVAADATTGRDRGGRPRARADPGDPRRAGARTGSSWPVAASWSTSSSDDASVGGRARVRPVPRRDRAGRGRDRPGAPADRARRLPRCRSRRSIPADGLLAFGTGGSMRDFWFAIIPHTAHVNLQLADGVDLPEP